MELFNFTKSVTVIFSRFLSLLTACNGFADAATLFVPKAAKPPELDGKIKNDEWAGAAKSGKFKLLAGSTNQVTEATEAFIMRDDTNLYIGFRCQESRIDMIKATIREKNGPVFADDDVELFIGIGENPASHRQFVVNSLGAQWDDWGGKAGDWQAKTLVDSNAWCVEMAIPFECLAVKRGEGLIFRGAFCRGETPRKEYSSWPYLNGGFNDASNYGRIVFGSYKAAGLRGIEELRDETVETSVPSGLAAEKTAILDSVNELEEEINVKSVLSTDEFRELNKKITFLEDRKVALEAKMVLERFAGIAASNNLHVTSETVRNGYELPDVWATRQILGKDFWFDIRHIPALWEKAGLEDEPFIKDSLMRFVVWGHETKDFEYAFFNPTSVVYQTLKQTNRPFIVAGNEYDGPIGLAPSVCRRFLKEYGHKFAGFTANECFGNYGTRYWQKADLPLPRTHHEAFLGFMSAYFNPTLDTERNSPRFRSWALCNPEFRTWTSCGTAVYLDHWILEMGAPFTGEEIIKCRPMQFAFSRGAARQYGKPWRAYFQMFWEGVVKESVVGYKGFLSPECRRYEKGCDVGPYSGEPLSLQRRTLYAAYMAGVNMMRDEGDGGGGQSVYVSHYDYRGIDKIDPLVKVLRDMPYCLSEVGAIRKELYDKIVKGQERGVPYTPVGVVFDRYHGFIPGYGGYGALGLLPYTEGDYMMRAINEALFPWEDGGPAGHKDGGDLVTGPYGDIFDALTNNAQLEILKSYRALLLAGDVELDKLFAERLMKYVEDGGTLVINASQVKEGTLSEAFLGCKISKERGKGRIAFCLPDKTVIIERKPFKYQQLEPISAKPLILRADGSGNQDVLATANNYGKGVVVLTAPDYMYESGSKNRMLDMFGYLLGHVRDELLPIKWNGNVEVLINRNSKGWVVTLMNNEGVIKKPGQKETFDDAKKANVWLRLNAHAGGSRLKEILEWTEGKKVDHDKTSNGAEIKIIVPPGDIRIFEFKTD